MLERTRIECRRGVASIFPSGLNVRFRGPALPVARLSKQIEPGGCQSCLKRHEKQTTELKAGHCREVKALKAELGFLRAVFAESTQNHEIEMLSMKAEYERLLSEVDKLKAENNSQRSVVQFLKLGEAQIDVVTQHLYRDRSQLALVSMAALAAKSATVHKMLSEVNTLNPDDICVELFNGDYVIYDAVMDFCVSGELTFSTHVSPDEVLRIAHGLQIGFLKEICEAELCRRLSVDNVPHMLKLSRKFTATRLQEKAEKVFKKNFDLLKKKVCDALECPDVVLEGWDDVEGANDGSADI